MNSLEFDEKKQLKVRIARISDEHRVKALKETDID